MARSHARIYVSIWRDKDFIALSESAQRMFFVLISQPLLSWAGVTPYTPKRWAGLASNAVLNGITKSQLNGITRALDELVTDGFVMVDEDTEEVWVRTLVRHDGVLEQPNVLKAMLVDYQAIASEPIRQAFRSEYPHIDLTPPPNPSGKGSGKGSSDPSGKASADPSSNPSVGSTGKGKGKGKGSHDDVQKFTLSQEPFAPRLGADEPERLDGLVGLTVVRERESS